MKQLLLFASLASLGIVTATNDNTDTDNDNDGATGFTNTAGVGPFDSHAAADDWAHDNLGDDVQYVIIDYYPAATVTVAGQGDAGTPTTQSAVAS